MSFSGRNLPPIECPRSDCAKQFKTYRGLGQHAMRVHGVCCDCLLRGQSECGCRQKEAAAQVDHGEYVRVTFNGKGSVILGDMAGDPKRTMFISGYVYNHRGELKSILKNGDRTFTKYYIHTGMIKRITPLSYNIWTGDLEPTLPENLPEAVLAEVRR